MSSLDREHSRERRMVQAGALGAHRGPLLDGKGGQGGLGGRCCVGRWALGFGTGG